MQFDFDLWVGECQRGGAGPECNFKFQMALLTSCAEKSKADRGFRRPSL
jgi:hypothetical protein